MNDRKMTWDEVVEELTKVKQENKELREKNQKLLGLLHTEVNYSTTDAYNHQRQVKEVLKDYKH